MDVHCEHDYQLETVGGVYLTGAYVCRLCSSRVGMSDAQFHQHAHYPRHYQEASQDQSLILHKTHTIRLISYRSDGQWMPQALVNSPTEREEGGHPLIGDPYHPLPTKEAADAVAKKLAMEWIDLQFASAVD
jgi:hypothetical protein